MGWYADTQEQDRKLDIAKYYVTRGKMQDLDEAVDDDGCTALYVASCRGHVDIEGFGGSRSGTRIRL